MAINDIQDKQARLAIAYGEHAVKGTLIKHDVRLVGAEKQVTVQQALGAGEWDGYEKIFYGGEEIAAANIRFHPGNATDALDDLFPDDTPHPNAAYHNTRLPAGMADEDRPERMEGIFRCLKVANYDGNGRQLDANGQILPTNANPRDYYFYSPNPARVAADLIVRWGRRRATRINWSAWVDWRDYCAELITETLPDTTTRQIPRFEAHVFFVPPFSLSAALDRLAQIVCADWQDANGKIRFMTPEAREPVFTFDLAKIGSGTFKTYPLDRRERPNQVIVNFRDLDDPFLAQADPPVTIDRPLLQTADGLPRPFELNIGVARRSQAQRVGNYWARVKCDLNQFAEYEGSPDSYPVLPADIVSVTHDAPDWTNLQFKVIEKEESEDTKLGYPLKLQLYSPNLYSDTDQSPVTRPPSRTRPNPFAPPPLVESVTLTERNTQLADGSVATSLLGTIRFAAFVNQQRGRVWIARPLETYRPVTVVTPERETNEGVFEIPNVAQGTYYIKVVAESLIGVSLDFSLAVEYTKVITGGSASLSAPTGLGATMLDSGQVRFYFDDPADRSIAYWRVRDASDAIIITRIDATEFFITPTANSITVKVSAVNRAGQEGMPTAPFTFTLPIPLTPSDFTVEFDGQRLIHRLTPLVGYTYDFATTNNGTGILATNVAGGRFEETSFPTDSRTITRYARARRFGVVSAWIGYTLLVPPPLAPTMVRQTEFDTPFIKVFRITPAAGTIMQNVLRSFTQVAEDAAFNTLLPAIAQPPEDNLVKVGGREIVSPAVYAKTAFEDLFGLGAFSLVQQVEIAGFLPEDFSEGSISGAALVVNSFGNQNILADSSFERTNLSADPYSVYGSGFDSVQPDATVYHPVYGKRSIKIVVTGNGFGNLSLPITLDAGNYVFSVWAQWQTVVGAVFIHAAGQIATRTEANSDGWERLFVKFTVAADNTPVSLLAGLGYDGSNATGTVWIDNWKLSLSQVVTDYSPLPQEVLPDTVPIDELTGVFQNVVVNNVTVQRLLANKIAVRSLNVVDANILRAAIALLSVDTGRFADLSVIMAKVLNLESNDFAAYVNETSPGSGYHLSATQAIFNGVAGISIRGKSLVASALRALEAINNSRRYVGNDNGKIPVTYIAEFSVNRIAVTDFEYDYAMASLLVRVNGWRILASSQTDTLHAASIRVIDKFGSVVRTIEVPFTHSRGTIEINNYSRKYADPEEEATFELRLINDVEPSDAVYLPMGLWQTGRGTLQTVRPIFLSITGVPLECVATAVNTTTARVTWVFSGAVVLYRRKRRPMGTMAWTNVATIAAGTSFFDDSTLEPDGSYEYQPAVSGDTNKRGNIAYVRTRAGAIYAGAVLPPSGLGYSDLTSTSLTYRWNRNATDNTGVEYSTDAGATTTTVSATTETASFSSLTPGSIHSFWVRNTKTGSPASEWTKIAVQIPQTPSGVTNPMNLTTSSFSETEILLNFDNPGSVNITIQYKKISETVYTTLNLGAITAYTLTELEASRFGTDYQILVRATAGTFNLEATEHTVPVYEQDPFNDRY